MKDPAFLFYTSDFLTGTMTMTDEQVGKYIRLLCLQHQKGRLTEKDMLFICKSYDEDIFSKFEQNGDGRYFNRRLEEETTRRKKYSESRAKNRASGKKESNNNPPKEEDKKIICESYDKHMETETETENIFNPSFSSSNIHSTTKEQQFNFDCIKENTQYLESVFSATVTARKYKLSFPKFQTLTDIFIADQKIKNCIPKNEPDYKDHFVNWMKIQTSKPENWDRKMVY